MRNRPTLLLAVALGAGTLAAFLAYAFLRAPDPASAQGAEPPTLQVVVAARDINTGTTLAAEDVKVVPWPGSSAPEGYATSVDQVIGLGAVVPMVTNEAVLPNKLASADLGRGMSMLVPKGFRAVSVPVNDVVAVAGWVRPGTHVDVMVTLDDVRTEQEPVTQVVLQNVPVLGNDKSIERDSEGEAVEIAVVTLLVTPQDAERLAMADNDGQLQLALRNNLDTDSVQTRGVRTSGLITGAPRPVVRAAAPRAAPPAPRTIEVIQGNKRSQSTVGRGGGGGE
jgi:pilus assembly protein CpaB